MGVQTSTNTFGLVTFTVLMCWGGRNSPSDPQRCFTAQKPAAWLETELALSVAVCPVVGLVTSPGPCPSPSDCWDGLQHAPMFAYLKNKLSFSKEVAEQLIDIHASPSKLVHLCLRHITSGTFTLQTRLLDLKGGSVKKDPIIPLRQKSGDATSATWQLRR